MNWELGRQGTGYLKRKLGQGKTWDLWLLKYPKGSKIPWHTDPVEGKRHWRLNIVLWGPQSFRGETFMQLWGVVLFRPDIMTHKVKGVNRVRYVLSLGWVR